MAVSQPPKTCVWPSPMPPRLGKSLNDGQVALVAQMALGGRRVALALAPAGAGKTTAMAALAYAWRSSGGQVLGLAPTAAAAIVLGEDLGAATDTLDKYVHCTEENNAAIYGIPDWFDQVGPQTLIVVDEAGMASTPGLDAMITTPLIGARVCGWSVMTLSSPPSPPAACCATSPPTPKP